MKLSQYIIPILVIFTVSAMSILADEEKCKNIKLDYPETKKEAVVDDYNGKKVTDEYRWLENFENPEVQKWTKAQNAVTRNIFDCLPVRGNLIERMKDLYSYPRQGAMQKRGEYYFYEANTGLQDQDILYRKKGLDGKPELVVDPMNLGKDETAAMNWYYVAPNGRYIAYGISTHGDEQAVLYVKDLETGKDLSEEIPGCRFGNVEWTSDSKAFYYPRFKDPKTVKKGHENFFPKIYYHKLGDDYKNDKVIHEDPKRAENIFGIGLSEDDRYLVINETIGTEEKSAVLVYDSTKDEKKYIFPKADAEYYLFFHKDRAFLRTTKDAPMYKLVEIDINNPSPENWKTIIPEKKGPLMYVTLMDGKFFTSYLENAHSTFYVYDMDGKVLKDASPPVIGSVAGYGGIQRGENEMFIAFFSFIQPTTVYRFDMKKMELETYYKPPLKFNPDDYVVHQEWFKSKDGTKVPMFLVHKKGIKKDGNNPTLVKGYGGFNVPYIPRFYASYIPFYEDGGVFALVTLRGGGEFGEEWHRAGMLENKQNVFDDFIASAEYLIKEKWTSKDKIAVLGGSNGGLLTGAVMVQRPDLFKAVVSAVPLLDMLRYHKFSIGRYWIPEYGSADNPEQFDFIKAYSPYHNINPDVSYPAVYLTAGASDSRVVPLHAMKFTAAIQNDTKTKEPVLLWVEYKSGHGQGKPLMKTIESEADMWTFIFWQLGMTEK